MNQWQNTYEWGCPSSHLQSTYGLNYQTWYPPLENQNFLINQWGSSDYHNSDYRGYSHSQGDYRVNCQNPHLENQNFYMNHNISDTQSVYGGNSSMVHDTNYKLYNFPPYDQNGQTQDTRGHVVSSSMVTIGNRNLVLNDFHDNQYTTSQYNNSLPSGTEECNQKNKCQLVNYLNYLYEMPDQIDCVNGTPDNQVSERVEKDEYVPNEPGEELRDCEAAVSVDIKPKHKLGCDNSSMFVKTSDQSAKKLCCPFCDKLFSKLAKHMETKHSGEPDVQKFLSFPKGSKNRREIQDSLRKIGALNFNKNAAVNNGELITSRRPNPKHMKKAFDYEHCPYCFGSYAKSAIRFHLKYHCKKKPIVDERTEGERVITKLATSVEARYHQDASPALQKVFNNFRNDNIVRGIRFDWLVTVYGNKLSAKYTKRNSKDMIRNKLRLVGRILSALKDIEPKITDFATLYHPKYYDRVVDAIKAVAKVDNVRKEFIAPSTASNAVTAIRQIGGWLIAEYIKKDDQENQRITQNFLTLMNSDIHISISKMVIETQSRMARQKQVILPSSEDVNRLAQYLENQRTECFNVLSKSYSFKNWLLLTEFTMASIIVFNRRRVGDTQNILDDDFTLKEVIDETTNEELFSNLSEQSKEIAKQYSRMKVRGKKNRTVPVLLKADVVTCLKLLISHRRDAGISLDNKFLFALPSRIDEDKVVNAGRILNKFAKACGAKNPQRLTATNLRKHMATVCVTMKLSDTSVADVAQFMGHAEKVHREYYRQNTIDRQVVQMSKVLEAAQGNFPIADVNDVNCNQEVGNVVKRKRKTPSPDLEVKSLVTTGCNLTMTTDHLIDKKIETNLYTEPEKQKLICHAD